VRYCLSITHKALKGRGVIQFGKFFCVLEFRVVVLYVTDLHTYRLTGLRAVSPAVRP